MIHGAKQTQGIKVAPALTRQEIRDKSRAWYARQLDVIAKAHGSSWPAHREWIEAYLQEELRERLIALGWRPKQ